MEKKVSIIIPVYNTGEYLRSCVDSVLAQTLEAWELLLVDDGSTDNSGAICDEYAQKDSRIRAIHKENQGVSMARNLGLELARGEYVGFVDSDDWVAPEMFGEMYRSARETGADIVMCDAVTVFGDGREEPDTITGLSGHAGIVREEWTPELLLEMAGSACRCTYRRALLEAHGVRFPVGLRFSEDRIFNLYAMGYANRVEYRKEPYYYRLLRADSAVHKFYPDYFEIIKDAAEGTRKALAQAWGDDEAFQRAYLTQMVGGALAALNNYFYRTSTLSLQQRLEKVSALCGDENLREAIRLTGFGGLRGKWILKRRVYLLSLCAQVLNWRHGR